MARLILVLVLLAALMTVVLIWVAQRPDRDVLPAAGPRPRQKETDMPGNLRHVAYGLLLALMFGVTTGWIGGL